MNDDIKAKMFGAAVRWGDARMAFLRLPSGSPETRTALGKLADAENDLQAIVSQARRKKYE